RFFQHVDEIAGGDAVAVEALLARGAGGHDAGGVGGGGLDDAGGGDRVGGVGHGQREHAAAAGALGFGAAARELPHLDERALEEAPGRIVDAVAAAQVARVVVVRGGQL